MTAKERARTVCPYRKVPGIAHERCGACSEIAAAIEAHVEAAVREAIERCAQRIEAARRDHGVGLDAAFFAGLVRALGKEGK